jgi:hypothetical protein
LNSHRGGTTSRVRTGKTIARRAGRFASEAPRRGVTSIVTCRRSRPRSASGSSRG